MADFVPLVCPDGMQLPGWEPWIGHWEDGWEIYEDEGVPMVVWDGVEMPCRLMLTATMMPVVEGVKGFSYRIEGTEMGLRCAPGTGGGKWIEIVGDSVKVLQRAKG